MLLEFALTCTGPGGAVNVNSTLPVLSVVCIAGDTLPADVVRTTSLFARPFPLLFLTNTVMIEDLPDGTTIGHANTIEFVGERSCDSLARVKMARFLLKNIMLKKVPAMRKKTEIRRTKVVSFFIAILNYNIGWQKSR